MARTTIKVNGEDVEADVTIEKAKDGDGFYIEVNVLECLNNIEVDTVTIKIIEAP